MLINHLIIKFLFLLHKVKNSFLRLFIDISSNRIISNFWFLAMTLIQCGIPWTTAVLHGHTHQVNTLHYSKDTTAILGFVLKQDDLVSVSHLNQILTLLTILESSEKIGLHSTKCSSETLQNLLYFTYKKTHVVFFVFHFIQLYILTL